MIMNQRLQAARIAAAGAGSGATLSRVVSPKSRPALDASFSFYDSRERPAIRPARAAAEVLTKPRLDNLVGIGPLNPERVEGPQFNNPREVVSAMQRAR